MSYKVKGVKEHRGHEGEALSQCRLYRNNKVVAFYSDGDWGGEAIIDWFKDGEEDLLKEHIKDMTWTCLEGKGLPMEPDIFIRDLIARYMYEKEMKRLMKTRAVFVENGALFEIKLKGGAKPDQRLFDYVQEKYPNATVLNILPMDKAVDVYMKNVEI